MAGNDASMPSVNANSAVDTSQNPPPEGSLRSAVRTASDFAWESCRLCRVVDSYPKSRRYVTLKLQQMYDSLVELYARAFMAQWSHFKRIADSINPPGTDATQAPVVMARLYITHWVLDVYNSNRLAISKLTPVAYTEYYARAVPKSSNEYDVFLAHLHAVIRPTQVKGYFEDQMYLPRFADEFDWNDDPHAEFNPFRINNWICNHSSFKAIILAIKEKRANWATATLSTEIVGRPVWLFDWHVACNVCSWFPRKDNYDMEDVMYAYLIGVACTPHLGPQDTDDWQHVPHGTNLNHINLDAFPRVRDRRYFGDYEVESYTIHEVSIDITNPEGFDVTTAGGKHKRARPTPRAEGDTSQPAVLAITAHGELPSRLSLMLRRTTFVYYERVIMEISKENRFTMLEALLTDSSTFTLE